MYGLYDKIFAKKIALADSDPKIGMTQKPRIIIMAKVEEIPKCEQKNKNFQAG